MHLHLHQRSNGRPAWACLAATIAAAAATSSHAQQQPFSFPPASQVLIELPSGTFPSHIAPADLNGNGKIDLAVSGRNNDGFAYIIPGNGDGTFSAPVPIELGAQSDRVVAADFNGNGHLDLAFALRSHRGRVAVMFNAGDGTFPDEPDFYRVGRLTEGLSARDIDGDGHIDLVAANTNSGTIRVLRNLGDGTFAVQAPIHIGAYAAGNVLASHINAADFNGDGLPEFAMMTSGTARASFVKNVNGALSTGADYRMPSHQGQVGGALNSTSADMNGDGKLDFVVPMALLNDSQRFAVYPGNGDGSLLEPVSFFGLGSGIAWTAAVADFDGDGRPDLAMGFALDGHLSLLRNTSSGGQMSFSSPQAFFSVSGFVRTIVPTDVNGNGVPDLIFTDYNLHRIRVWLNETPQGGGGGLQDPPSATRSGDDRPRGRAEAVPGPLSDDDIRARLSIPADTPLDADLILRRLAAMGDVPRDDLNRPHSGAAAGPDNCGSPEFGDCFEVNGTVGCDDAECCAIVCNERPYCCTTDWDELCVELAKKLCEVPPPPCPGKFSCFEAHDEIGCSDEDCCEFICFLDGFCCSIGWDETCAELAALLCDTQACSLGQIGGIPEPEECPERLNDGCLLPTPAFTNIACGQTYRGTAFTGGTRDSDWYRLNVVQGPRRITFTVTSEFPSQMYIIRGTCSHDIEVLSRGFGGFCTAASVSACVEPGAYFLVVSPGTPIASLRRGAPCPDDEAKDPPPVIWGVEYLALASCGECLPPILGDLNGDGHVDVLDLLILLSSWGDCPQQGDCPADLNGSGAVDVQDLLILLANWG